MTQLLVDTSVLVQAQRQKKFLEVLEQHQRQLVISRVTAYELIWGARNTTELKHNQSLVNHLPVLELTQDISKLAHTLLTKHALNTHLSIPDALIAATALQQALPLWTLNTKDFAGIGKLTLFVNN